MYENEKQKYKTKIHTHTKIKLSKILFKKKKLQPTTKTNSFSFKSFTFISKKNTKNESSYINVYTLLILLSIKLFFCCTQKQK